MVFLTSCPPAAPTPPPRKQSTRNHSKWEAVYRKTKTRVISQSSLVEGSPDYITSDLGKINVLRIIPQENDLTSLPQLLPTKKIKLTRDVYRCGQIKSLYIFTSTCLFRHRRACNMPGNIRRCRWGSILFLSTDSASLRSPHPLSFSPLFSFFLNQVFFQVLYCYSVSAIKVPSWPFSFTL